ncbi:MAG: helix-turn-helix domain-containing protein [Cyclobacteriaceae bacterium]
MLIVNIVGITLLSIFMLFVVIKKDKGISDLLLSIVIVLFAAYLGSHIWIQYDLSVWSFAFQTVTAFSLFFPFLLYALILIEDDHRVKKYWWWFASFDVIFFFFILSDLFVFNDYSTQQILNLYTDPPFIYHVLYKGHIVYNIVLIFWYLKKLRLYSAKIMDYYSNIEQVRLQWVKYFSWANLTINLMTLIVFVPYNYGYIDNIQIPFLAINAAFVLWLFYLIYSGIKQYTLANFSEPDQSGRKESTIAKKKYQTSSLAEEEMNSLYDRIRGLFEKEQVFHDPELKVQSIAQQLKVTTHNISQTINSKASKPFYDFVNHYRVEELKRHLTNPEMKKYTILALGLESGFNSKASLNRIFKQHIGQTPKEYQLQNAS